MSLEAFSRKALQTLKQQAPTILTVMASAGFIATVYMAVKATPKAIAVIEGVEEEKDDLLTPLEKIQLTWAFYAPAAAVGAATLTCMVSSNVLSVKRQAALMGAFTLSETAFKQFREKTAEALGPTKEQKVIDEAAKERLAQSPSNEVIVLGSGEVECFDSYSGRRFKSNADLIRKAENKFNKMLIDDRCGSLNEFYHLVGLTQTEAGETVGWNSDELLEVSFTSALEDDKPVMVMSFRRLPFTNYHKVW